MFLCRYDLDIHAVVQDLQRATPCSGHQDGHTAVDVNQSSQRNTPCCHR